MSVQPAERPSKVCQHVWIDSQDPSESHPHIERIGFGLHHMRPGHTYVCQDCHCRVYIKHRGILHSTIPNERHFYKLYSGGYIAPFLFASYCICGVRYPEVNYYRGPTGKEYALSRMRAHVERCNQHRVFHEHNINFHSA
jgi:hypothetical protein